MRSGGAVSHLPPENQFSPKLSIAFANSRQKSANRRRSGISCRTNQKLTEFSNRAPVFLGKPRSGGFAGKAGRNREPASIKIVWAA